MSNLNRLFMLCLTLNFDYLCGSENLDTTTVVYRDSEMSRLLFMLGVFIRGYGCRFDGFSLGSYEPEVCTNEMARKVFEDALFERKCANCLLDFIEVSEDKTLMITASVKHV